MRLFSLVRPTQIFFIKTALTPEIDTIRSMKNNRSTTMFNILSIALVALALGIACPAADASPLANPARLTLVPDATLRTLTVRVNKLDALVPALNEETKSFPMRSPVRAYKELADRIDRAGAVQRRLVKELTRLVKTTDDLTPRVLLERVNHIEQTRRMAASRLFGKRVGQILKEGRPRIPGEE